MNTNVKVAKQLVVLAKALLADGQDSSRKLEHADYKDYKKQKQIIRAISTQSGVKVYLDDDALVDDKSSKTITKWPGKSIDELVKIVKGF
jgi:hypothetical protein